MRPVTGTGWAEGWGGGRWAAIDRYCRRRSQREVARKVIRQGWSGPPAGYRGCGVGAVTPWYGGGGGGEGGPAAP